MFQEHKYFHDILGNTVVPGMNLSDILVFHMGGKSSDGVNVYPISSKIKLFDRTYQNGVNVADCVSFETTLLDEQYPVDKLAYYTAHRHFKIPEKYFSCTIPKLGPSFLCNEVSRTYLFHVEFTFTNTRGDRFKLEVYLPLFVAADRCDCLIKD